MGELSLSAGLGLEGTMPLCACAVMIHSGSGLPGPDHRLIPNQLSAGRKATAALDIFRSVSSVRLLHDQVTLYIYCGCKNCSLQVSAMRCLQ